MMDSTPHSLDDLAALHALDALDNDDLIWAETQGAEMSEFLLAVDQYRSVAAELAYGAEPVPMADGLKDRLFQRLVAETPQQLPTAIADLVQQSQTVQWQPYDPNPSVLIATLTCDPAQRHIQYFVRSWDQVIFPRHRHAGKEEVIVLEGDLKIGDQTYHPGDRIYSDPGTEHQPQTLNGCLLCISTSLDDEIFS